MLTVRTSAHIPTNQHRRSFRLCPTSTGAPPARTGSSRLLREWIRLLDAESRRLWLDDRWRAHLRTSPVKTIEETAMKDSDCAAVSDSPAKEPAVPVARGRNYLYAIVAGGEPRSYPSLGIEGNDVYTITEGRVAAVVSGLAGPKIRPQRANLAAHQAVLKSSDGRHHPAAHGLRHRCRQPGSHPRNPGPESARLPGAAPARGRQSGNGVCA